MGRFAYIKESSNLLKPATITVSSENPIYSKANLVALPVSRPFRTLSGYVTSQTIEFDLGAAAALDTFAIVNHNFTPSVSLTLRAGSTANPNGSQFQQTITYQSRRVLFKRFTSASWRYWRLLISDSTNTDGYLKIGYTMGGALVELSSYFQFNWRRVRYFGKGGAVSEVGSPIATVSRGQWDGIELSFETRVDDDRNELDSFLQGLRGDEVPLLAFPDSEKSEVFFGRLKSEYSMTQTSSFITQFSPLLFAEDSVGVVLPAGNLFP